jgi:predicted glycoside hydrolase/deacetylase ChbG (UPF0249 family)
LKLILTADDYGLEEHIDAAIVDAVSLGRITSVACFANLPFENLKSKISKLVAANPNLHLGIHLNLTAGKSLSGYHGFTEQGYFKPSNKMAFSKLDLSAIETELTMQINRFLAVLNNLSKESGLNLCVAHISSHINILYLSPKFFNLNLKIARKYGLAMRASETLPDLMDLPFKYSLPLAWAGFKVLHWRDILHVVRYFTKKTRAAQMAAIKSHNLLCTNLLVPNVYGNTTTKDFMFLVSKLKALPINKAELVFHLSNGLYPPLPTNGINAGYFGHRIKETALLNSAEFLETISDFEK